MANNIVYSPVIAATLPAFTTEQIIIPFAHNPAVAADEVDRFVIIFKDTNTSQILLTVQTNKLLTKDEIITQQIVYNFTTTEQSVLATNTSYKVQVAYLGDGQAIADIRWSTVGIARCITKPTLYLAVGKQTTLQGIQNNLVFSQSNKIGRLFSGAYCTATTSETVYEYCFILSQGAKILEDTGWLIHNSVMDKIELQAGIYNKLCIDYIELQSELVSNAVYTLTYKVRTVNRYETIIKQNIYFEGYELDEIYSLSIGQDITAKENGYLLLQLNAINVTNENEYTKLKENNQKAFGTFVIRRADSNSNYSRWDNIYNFDIIQDTKWDFHLQWCDATVEHGVTYKYALSRLENDNVTSWVETKPFTVYFEHMYLSDSEKQLCIKFNPNVSSLKRTTQETKVDTIGGKYPFFFKNGDIYYTELPITGLLSYQLDDAELFISKQDLGLNLKTPLGEIINLPTINLEDYNIVAERKFKLAVLDWLNNGKPKYFRSPTEGNYIIRTLNNSLSPQATVGRMLHTFSSTGYETAENTVTNLIKLQTFRVFNKLGREQLL